MSSDSERDIGDFVTGNSTDEDGTLFLPSPEGNTDPWTLFFSGILIGLAGGALVTVGPWLAGALIMTGYFLTALSLKGSSNRLANGLCFGFIISAILGAALIACEIGAPKGTSRFIVAAGNRHLVFPTVALIPWALGFLRYVHILIWRPNKRRPRTRMA
jgi:hypothetical protein